MRVPGSIRRTTRPGVATLVVVLLGALGLASISQAAIPLQNPKGQPLDTTQAGAPTRFNIHIELGGDEHIKDLTQQLPAGLGNDPFYPTCAVAAWQADNCAENSQVGTSEVGVTVGIMPETVPGRIYYLEPEGSNLPSLGIILDSPTGKQFQRAEVRINPELGVLESTIRDFPQSAPVGPIDVPIRINEIDVILTDRFVKNPLTCDTVVTRFIVNSYEDPDNPTTAEAPLTPTGCEPPTPPLCDDRPSTLLGTGARDVINGTPRRDVISGFRGNDLIRGRGGNDLICGGKGNDSLFGGAGRDTLFGAAGRDSLFGGAGRDTLFGGALADILRGGAGVDVLRGGRGADNERQ